MCFKRREGKTAHASADTLLTVRKGRCLIKRFVDKLSSKLSQILFTKDTSSTHGSRKRDESFCFTATVALIGRTVANNNERRTRNERMEIEKFFMKKTRWKA